jgi:hypothetical protein
MTARALVFASLFAWTSSAPGDEPAMRPGFQKSSQFDEQERWARLASGVRIFVNAPLPMTRRERALAIFATPNGNTIEQTLGCAGAEGRDWHFDIQHVAAQIRRLREISPDEDIVLAVVQAPQLSWPAFRQAEPNANAIIQQIVESTARDISANRIALSGHSGGGSFLFGCIDAAETIPESVERIVFLDANYAYSDEKKHGEKLLDWLRGDQERRLVVIAYDDREITLNGKKVVGPTGGTFRASQRMLERIGKEFTLTEEQRSPFVHRTGMNAQIEFFVHPNPENKILHTALVGDMNGLLHGLTLGTSREEKWGVFGGPRAYLRWVQADPATESPAAQLSEPPATTNAREQLKLPPRRADAPTGSQFLEQVKSLPRDEREAAILKEITRGNIPEFLRTLKEIRIEAADAQGAKHTATCFVMPDYLAVGTDKDFFRMPMSPQTAQAIADAADASLLTTKLSDDIFKLAEVKLLPKPLTKDRDAAATFYQHHQIIEQQREGQPLGLLVAGIKKDVVFTNRLRERSQRVAIYGWHYPDGKPIQPLYIGHVDWYVDYSHGIRLLSQRILVDGQPMRVDDVLKHPMLSVILSNEGPIEIGYK